MYGIPAEGSSGGSKLENLNKQVFSLKKEVEDLETEVDSLRCDQEERTMIENHVYWADMLLDDKRRPAVAVAVYEAVKKWSGFKRPEDRPNLFSKLYDALFSVYKV